MTTDLTDLRNIGPRTAGWLAEVGIDSAEELRRVGAVAAWTQMKQQRPDQVTLNALYALYGALTDVDWRVLDEAEREELCAQAAL